MDNKKNFLALLLIIIILVTGWYLLGVKKTGLPITQNENNQTENKKSPEMPKFVFGEVTKIEGQKIFIKAGAEEKTVLTEAKTVVINQIKDGESYKNVSATFDDIKISQKIVVYYNQNSGSEYTAEKIQILNF